mmetsp:Transcript_15395/g.26938  ORF Transcript_15395/g.26938 Transcript_15395/m.26938 type:complete len:355 (+) Transcript_15395:35-1099(+)
MIPKWLWGWLLVRDNQYAAMSVMVLTFQGTALAVTLRFSRMTSTMPYLSSVVVIFTELSKLLICIAVWTVTRQGDVKSSSSLLRILREFADILKSSLPLAIPACLFVFQQVLVILAASNLDAVTFEIFGQSFKIVPTAIFAALLLKQKLTATQWLSLPILVSGVVLVSRSKSSSEGAELGNRLLGILASSLGGLSSAFAGVYFEKCVKSKALSIWVRNMQLSIFGLPLSIAYAIAKDGAVILEDGPMRGFDWFTWGVVLLQVVGGLVVGMVVKYTSNVLKNFANAVSVIFTVLLSIPLFGIWPNFVFLLGVAIVLFSVFLYGGDAPLLLVLLKQVFPWDRRVKLRDLDLRFHNL